MAILQLLQQLLTTKVTAVLAALALVGGGAAVAAPGMGDEPTDDETETTEVVDDDEVDLDGLEEQQLQQMADACAEDEGSGLCSGDSPDRDEDEGAMEVVDPDGEEAPEGEDVEGEEDTRSETAKRVHRALTGSDDIVPGDPEFGKRVSERARSGQPGDLGRLVSRAARGDDPISDDELVLEERERPGRGNERDDEEPVDPEPTSEAAVEDAEPTEDEGSEVSGRPERAGPPAGDRGGNRGNGRGGR